MRGETAKEEASTARGILGWPALFIMAPDTSVRTATSFVSRPATSFLVSQNSSPNDRELPVTPDDETLRVFFRPAGWRENKTPRRHQLLRINQPSLPSSD